MCTVQRDVSLPCHMLRCLRLLALPLATVALADPVCLNDMKASARKVARRSCLGANIYNAECCSLLKPNNLFETQMCPITCNRVIRFAFKVRSKARPVVPHFY